MSSDANLPAYRTLLTSVDRGVATITLTGRSNATRSATGCATSWPTPIGPATATIRSG